MSIKLPNFFKKYIPGQLGMNLWMTLPTRIGFNFSTIQPKFKRAFEPKNPQNFLQI